QAPRDVPDALVVRVDVLAFELERAPAGAAVGGERPEILLAEEVGRVLAVVARRGDLVTQDGTPREPAGDRLRVLQIAAERTGRRRDLGLDRLLRRVAAPALDHLLELAVEREAVHDVALIRELPLLADGQVTQEPGAELGPRGRHRQDRHAAV